LPPPCATHNSPHIFAPLGISISAPRGISHWHPEKKKRKDRQEEKMYNGIEKEKSFETEPRSDSLSALLKSGRLYEKFTSIKINKIYILYLAYVNILKLSIIEINKFILLKK